VPDQTGLYSLSVLRGCDCTLTPDKQSYDYHGGSGEFGLTLPPDCAWRIESKPDWVSVGSGGGTGNGKVGFAVAAAGGMNGQREGAIRISLDNYSGPDNKRDFAFVQTFPCAYSITDSYPPGFNSATSLGGYGTLDFFTGSY